MPRARELQDLVEAYHPPSTRIAAAHGYAVAAVRLSRQAWEETARSYRTGGDAAGLARARHLTDDEARQWRRWLDALLAL